jgi:hypothetical protein
MSGALLSPQMAKTLAAIVNRPGNFPNFYPGGRRSVNALERRGLVRFDQVDAYGYLENAVFPTAPGFRLGHELPLR